MEKNDVKSFDMLGVSVMWSIVITWEEFQQHSSTQLTSWHHLIKSSCDLHFKLEVTSNSSRGKNTSNHSNHGFGMLSPHCLQVPSCTGATIKFPGWGSAWTTPTSKIIASANRWSEGKKCGTCLDSKWWWWWWWWCNAHIYIIIYIQTPSNTIKWSRGYAKKTGCEVNHVQRKSMSMYVYYSVKHLSWPETFQLCTVGLVTPAWQNHVSDSPSNCEGFHTNRHMGMIHCFGLLSNLQSIHPFSGQNPKWGELPIHPAQGMMM